MTRVGNFLAGYQGCLPQGYYKSVRFPTSAIAPIHRDASGLLRQQIKRKISDDGERKCLVTNIYESVFLAGVSRILLWLGPLEQGQNLI